MLGLGFLLVWFRVELLFRQGLFGVCFSAGWGILRVGLGFIPGRFRAYLGLV